MENDRNLNLNVNKMFITNSSHFSFETYFIFFSALIFLTEMITDYFLVAFYIKGQFGSLVTSIGLSIIIVPCILCQIYSFAFLRRERNLSTFVVVVHILFLSTPYRYYNILSRFDKDKMNNHEKKYLKNRIKEINAIQMVNAVFQYLPQFFFQTYLISVLKFKFIITGLASGLAGFSFLWYMVLLMFYYFKRRQDEKSINNAVIQDIPTNHRHIIENLATTRHPTNNLAGSTTSTIESNLKNYEKPLYKTNDKNLISNNKKPASKFIEKEQIFNFNKRKPIYKGEEFSLYDLNNQSTEFYEINESMCTNFSKSKETEEMSTKKSNPQTIDPATGIDIENNNPMPGENRGTLLKRKGICSSTEMLHLVDIMNDNIAPDQIDTLAKNLAELSGGEDSLNLSSVDAYCDLDNTKLMDIFPNEIDEKQLENIDAAIYENQIIFEERIRKNQLTIQNLKLQDEILSNDIDIGKKLSSLSNNTDTLSQNDYYENMLLSGINRLDRLKHWRNYLNDLNTSLHDNSTIQHSSFYMLTTTATPSLSSYATLYINEPIRPKSSLIASSKPPLNRKMVQWSEKLTQENEYDESISDDFYIHMNSTENNDDEEVPPSTDSLDLDEDDDDDDETTVKIPKSVGSNILVETINKINVDSPMKKNMMLGGAHNLSGATTIDGDTFESFVENI